jgi:hypothetical protein
LSVNAGALSETPGRLTEHAQLEQPVVEQDAVARPHVVGQVLVGDRHEAVVPDGARLGGEQHLLARGELERLVARERADTDLGALEVLDDCDGPAERRRLLPHQAVERLVLAGRAVGEIQAHDIYPGLE